MLKKRKKVNIHIYIPRYIFVNNYPKYRNAIPTFLLAKVFLFQEWSLIYILGNTLNRIICWFASMSL